MNQPSLSIYHEFVKSNQNNNIKTSQLKVQDDLQFQYDLIEIMNEVKNAIPLSLENAVRNHKLQQQSNNQSESFTLQLNNNQNEANEHYYNGLTQISQIQEKQLKQSLRKDETKQNQYVFNDNIQKEIKYTNQANHQSDEFAINQQNNIQQSYQTYEQNIYDKESIDKLIETTQNLLQMCKQNLAHAIQVEQEYEKLDQNRHFIQESSSKHQENEMDDLQVEQLKIINDAKIQQHQKTNQMLNKTQHIKQDINQYNERLYTPKQNSLGNIQKKYAQIIEQQLKEDNAKQIQLEDDIDIILTRYSTIINVSQFH